jgi:flagellar basal body P-ring protein FlgI
LRCGRACLCLAGALLAALAGCTNTPVTRAKVRDENEGERYPVKTVGDVTTVGNAEPVKVGGVGLVEGLDGTGGDTVHDAYWSMLEQQLQKENVRNVKALLASPNNALVIVEAELPPGANKNDPIDLVVQLPPGSRATSLRGGVLRKCPLRDYDFANRIDPKVGNQLLQGHILVHAEGPIQVGVGAGDEVRLRQGRIWQGGRAVANHPFLLVLNADPHCQRAQVAALVADRVNETFQATLRGGMDVQTALAKNARAVDLRVPPQYRYNQEHFLRVVRMVPLSGNADAPLEGSDKRSYRKRLEADLLDPALTVVAALRLEALGKNSTASLKEGLKSKHPLVRFCAAESLAYLGSPSCADELARAVREQSMLRPFALTALASLDEGVCNVQLRELVCTATDDETRYGAFRALHTIDPKDPTVRGEQLNESFWLHRVAPNGPPLVHLTSRRRAEIALFGQPAYLKPPFSLLAGEFVVTATEDDSRASVRRIPVGGALPPRQCGLEVEAVVRAMAELGAQYSEVVAVIQQAEASRCVSCRVRCDAVPRPVSVHDLVKAGRDDSSGELLQTSGQDLGGTPTLFELGLNPSSVRVSR